MGLVRLDVEVARPGRRAKWHAAPRVLIDSGSELSWFPGALLRELGVTVFKRGQIFIRANRREIGRDLGVTLVRCGEFKTVDEVVFGLPGDLTLLGAHTLEGFNVIIDLRRKRLVSAGPMPAAAA